MRSTSPSTTPRRLRSRSSPSLLGDAPRPARGWPTAGCAPRGPPWPPWPRARGPRGGRGHQVLAGAGRGGRGRRVGVGQRGHAQAQAAAGVGARRPPSGAAPSRARAGTARPAAAAPAPRRGSPPAAGRSLRRPRPKAAKPTTVGREGHQHERAGRAAGGRRGRRRSPRRHRQRGEEAASPTRCRRPRQASHEKKPRARLPNTATAATCARGPGPAARWPRAARTSGHDQRAGGAGRRWPPSAAQGCRRRGHGPRLTQLSCALPRVAIPGIRPAHLSSRPTGADGAAGQTRQAARRRAAEIARGTAVAIAARHEQPNRRRRSPWLVFPALLAAVTGGSLVLLARLPPPRSRCW
jgi:hypothetical protein